MNTETNEKFIAKAAKALGDRHRLIILQEIARQGSINCTQAQQLTNLAQPSISHHIRQLVNSELIDTDKKGREVNLIINQPKMDEFLSTLGTMKALVDGV
jgi:ArsR family transcriptional regulator, arsenate/arsenite/antimonite-responsive transcriptional repressor